MREGLVVFGWNIKVVGSDYDNTMILDPVTRKGSEEAKKETWFKVFPEYERSNLNEKINEINKLIAGGKGDRKDIVRGVLKYFNREEPSEDEVKMGCDRFNEKVQAEIIKIGISEDNREALARLSDKIPIYIFTATPEEQCKYSLNELGLSKYITRVYGRPNTKEESLEKIILAENAKPEEVLCIDDQPSARRIADKIGCPFVGMHTAAITEWHNSDELDFPVIRSLSELL